MTRLRLLFFLYFAKGIDATIESGLFRFSYCMILVVGLEVIRAIYWRKDQTLPAKLVPSFVCDMATRSSSRVLRVLPVPIVVDLFHEIPHQQVLQNVVTDRNSSLAACFDYSCTGFLGSDSGASHGFRQKG